ncbi:MAG: serine/threonine protein kinase [Cyanobacteria bacterium REEB67]|nr:serine/threonine protein kinase [Cyanobacteria bacterium REEB67]
MGTDGEKPIVLRETCELCSKPIFPIKPGSTNSLVHRPGFCNCAVKTVKPSPATLTGTLPDLALPEVKPSQHFNPTVQLADVVESGYRFFDRIGKGTMGYVYQAETDNIDALLAIKIFHRGPFTNKRTLKRLEQEATLAIGASHPHLASVYKFGVSAKNYPFIVMDFMAGPSLADILAHEGFLDVPRALDIFIQISEALEYAHGEKLLHRGIKPSKIYLLKAAENRDFVKVSDFGIAKILPNPGRETKYMTPQGEEFGNPSYMSPEQCLGTRLDARSDLYSFGCLMYQCLTGKLPHTSSNPMRIAFKQISEEARSMVERFLDLDIPPDIDRIVLTCLQKNPDDRFETAKQLRLALEAVRDGKRPKLPNTGIGAGFSGITSGGSGKQIKITGIGLSKDGSKDSNFIDNVLKIFKKPKEK